MKLIINFLVLILLGVARAADERSFPKDFMFGTGTSAYQTEGAWNENGKSENIWDYWIHEDPTHIKNNDTADTACDSYNVYNVIDAYYIHNLHVHHYRLSIPWSRILPNVTAEEVNMDAVTHYQKYIQSLKDSKVKTVVTLYYNDLPQALQDMGGWLNPNMAKYFADYARICFQYFADVDYWITFNDPRAICRHGYGDGIFAPGISSDGVDEYICAYTVLKAHAAAYHVYNEEFGNLEGKISIAIDIRWSEPASENDKEAAERRNAFEFGLYANPIYKENWPQEVIDRIGLRSKKENLSSSRLPQFTEEEIKYISGTSDFMAVNLYYTDIVEDAEEAVFDGPSYENDMKVKAYINSDWEVAENGQPIVPASARKALVWLSENFKDKDIFITENGVPDDNILEDYTRINYYRTYLSAILDAILEDGIKVIAYTAWSLVDSFEWTDGYSYKFGFYHINFNSGNKFRTEKKSVNFYKQLIQTLVIPDEEPTNTSTTSTNETPTGTSTNTPTGTSTDTPTDTPTGTSTGTSTNIPTGTSTGTSTDIPTSTSTGSPTDTPTNNPSDITGGTTIPPQSTTLKSDAIKIALNYLILLFVAFLFLNL